MNSATLKPAPYISLGRPRNTETECCPTCAAAAGEPCTQVAGYHTWFFKHHVVEMAAPVPAYRYRCGRCAKGVSSCKCA